MNLGQQQFSQSPVNNFMRTSQSPTYAGQMPAAFPPMQMAPGVQGFQKPPQQVAPQQFQQPQQQFRPQPGFHQPIAAQPGAYEPQRDSVQSQGMQNQLKSAQNPGHGANGVATGDKKREMQLEKRVVELELLLRQKDTVITNLQNELKKAGVNSKVVNQKSKPTSPMAHKSQMIDAKPTVLYEAVTRNDPVDVRLEEFYNSTNSAIQFQRINRGWYKFGSTLVELEIVNHKLMAKTDEGWNRGKYGDIEKFLCTFEPIEREIAGIPFDA